MVREIATIILNTCTEEPESTHSYVAAGETQSVGKNHHQKGQLIK